MRRRHSVTGVLYVKSTGSAGQGEWVPVELEEGESAPSVRCNVHPLSTEEIQFWGERAKDTRHVFTDTWPFDEHSRLTFQGVEWDQVAPSQEFDLGMKTQHIEVIIRKR